MRPRAGRPCSIVWFVALVALIAPGRTAWCADTREADPSPPARRGASPARLLPGHPLTLADCLNLAESSNPSIAAARTDLRASHGIAVQTRAVLLPRVEAAGSFAWLDPERIESVDTPFGRIDFGQDETWEVGVRLVQSIYEGGRMGSARRASRLTRELAIHRYQTVLLDVLLQVRIAFYDALLAREQITVHEAAVQLLERELADSRRRFDAGNVPRFNVLRAEVELANARPRLIRARNDWRNARIALANLLGFQVPQDVTEDFPIELAGTLETPPFEPDLADALARAQERRTELKALEAVEGLRREDIVSARSGFRPSVQAFAGYGAQRSQFEEDLGAEHHGWTVGVQANWNIFDGGLSRGRTMEAEARRDRARIERESAARDISVEVRVAFSNFIEAREVLASQEKVVEQAVEALRLATARAEAGSGTQLDVLGAQTSLTEARTTWNVARHDYLVALARLQRAVGPPVVESAPEP